MIDFSRNFFELFGLPTRYRVEPTLLDAAYRRLQSEVHPDQFARGNDAQRRAALQSSAHVNEAYRALKDPVQRAQYLLTMHGVDAVGESDNALPFAFLEAQLERREAAAQAAEARDARTLAALLDAVRADAGELEVRIAAQLDVEQAYPAARGNVRELTFLRKLADDLDAMLAALDD